MKYHFTEITERVQWEAGLGVFPQRPFPQSWLWGEFRKTCRVPVRRFAILDEAGRIAILAQGEFRSRRFGVGYWFFPRGPIFGADLSACEKKEVLTSFCAHLATLPELSYRTLFWRMEPYLELTTARDLLSSAWYPSDSLNPASTEMIDLQQSTDELLARMHEKTRYNIRLAERKNVLVRLATTEKEITTFLDLMDETARRDRFTQHDRNYLEQTIAFVTRERMGCVRLAEYEGKILSANLEIRLGDTVTYLYGTSSSHDRNVMAPYALHWDAIQSAKRDGYRFYDFWGSNPLDHASPAYKKSWEGITRFKRGWGGDTHSYVGTWDLPIRPFLYRLVFWKR